MFHHYAGKTLEIIEIETATGKLIKTRLGKDILNGEVLQYTVKAGNIFGSRLLDQKADDWVLVGCSVTPAFTFDVFEMPTRESLMDKFPEHRVEVERMTNGSK